MSAFKPVAPSVDLVTIQEIWNPATGELVPASDINGVAEAVKALRDFSQKIRDAVADATVVLVEESKRQGTKTLPLANVTAVISGGDETVFDIETLRTDLETLGCPQERLEALIKTEITYKVDRRVAKQLSAANEDYAEAIEASQSVVPKPFYVKIKAAEPF